MTTKSLSYVCVLAFCVEGVTNASWLSDVTGINIDLAKAVGRPVTLNAVSQPIERLPQIINPPTVPVATTDEIATLKKQVDAATDRFKLESDRYDTYSITWAVGSILLALAAAIFGFLRKPVAAGVLSLVVMSSTAMGKAIPIRERATYFQTLYGQAYTLQLDLLRAKTTMPLDDFNARSKALTQILLYASKLPGVGDVGSLTAEIIKDTRLDTSPK
jgi:hypothetical protein